MTSDDGFIIKTSPGKGLAVFASRELIGGEQILSDRPVAMIRKAPHDMTEGDVTKAFKNLSRDEQNAFLELHEGSRPFKSKLSRIYRSNCFLWEEKAGPAACIAVRISRFNHSCIPNAVWKQEKGYLRVYALTPIRKGQEISICYNDNFTYMTGDQRMNFHEYVYGFTCSCKACKLDTKFSRASDNRRKEMGSLYFRMQGCQMPDFSLFTPRPNSDTSKPIMIRREAHPNGPLHRWSLEAVEIQHRLTQLLDEEGLRGQLWEDCCKGAKESLIGYLCSNTVSAPTDK